MGCDVQRPLEGIQGVLEQSFIIYHLKTDLTLEKNTPALEDVRCNRNPVLWSTVPSAGKDTELQLCFNKCPISEPGVRALL